MYRVFLELWTLLLEIIFYVLVFVVKKISYECVSGFEQFRNYDNVKLRIKGEVD